MKRILYLSLLLVVPFLIQADHGRNKLNGKWISPYFNTQIKIKVKRHEIRVKGLNRRGWITFTPIRRNVFGDCSGNRIKINSIHDLVFSNRYKGIRIRFVKKGHNHHHHSCNSRCAIGDDFFAYSGYGQTYSDDYYEDENENWGYNDDRWRSRNGNGSGGYSDNRFDRKYHVRELDEYVTLNRTKNGLRAKRENGDWVEYRQNRYRKNEYLDKRGNKFLVRSNGDITWKSKDGKVSLNLQK